MNPQDIQLDPTVTSIVRALALTENGGKVHTDNPSQGQSGEMKSIFQFTPGTWKMYSKEVLGREVPMDKNNESAVVYGKVHNWIQDGLKPEEIASIWNSGKPDAYLQNYKGTNKYGVQYDTPGYVKKFSRYLQESQNKTVPTNTQQQAVTKNTPQAGLLSSQPPVASTKNPGILPGLMAQNNAPQMKQARQI